MATIGPFLTPRVVQSKTGNKTGTDVTVTLDAAPTPGNVMLMPIGVDATGRTITVPTGFTAIGAGVDQGTDKQLQYCYRVVLPGDGAAHQASIDGASADLVAEIVELEYIDPDNPVDLSDYDSASSVTTDTFTLDSATKRDMAYIHAAIAIDGASTALTWDTNSDEVTDLNLEDGANIDMQTADAVVNWSEAFDAVADWTTSSNSAGGLVALNAARVFGNETPKRVQADTDGSNGTEHAASLGAAPTNTDHVMVSACMVLDAVTLTQPTNWTLVGQTSGAGHTFGIAYKQVAAGEVASHTWSHDGSAADCISEIVEVSGLDISDPDGIHDRSDFDNAAAATTDTYTLDNATRQDVEWIYGGVGADSGVSAVSFDILDDNTGTLEFGSAELNTGDEVVHTKSAFAAVASWTGSSASAGGMVAFRAKRQPYATPVVVQSKAVDTSSTTSHVFALDDEPTVGNVVLVMSKIDADTTLTIDTDLTAISAHSGDVGATPHEGSVAYRVAVSGDTGSFTYTSGSSTDGHAVLYEIANVDVADLVTAADFVDANFSSGTSDTLTADEIVPRSAGIAIAYIMGDGATGGSEAFTLGFSAATASNELFAGYKVFAQADTPTTVASWTSSIAGRSGLLCLNAAPMTGYCTPYRVQGAGGVENSDTHPAALSSAPSAGSIIWTICNTSAAGTLTAPDGFTTIRSGTIGNLSGHNLAEAYKVADGTEGTTFNWTSSSSNWAAWIIAEYRGIDTNNPIIDALGATEGLSSSNSGTEQEITAAGTNDSPAMITCSVHVDDFRTAFAATNSFDKIFSSFGTWDPSIAAFDRVVSSLDTYATTMSWNSTATQNAATLTAFRAAPNPIIRWQEAELETGGTDDTPTVTLPQVPTPGNTTVVIFAMRDSESNGASAPTGYTEITDVSIADWIDNGAWVGVLEVYYRVNQAGDSSAITVTCDNAPVGSAIWAGEYEGITLNSLVTDTETEDGGAATTLDELSLVSTSGNSLLLNVAALEVQNSTSTHAVTKGFLFVGDCDEESASDPQVIIGERIVCTTGTYAPVWTWAGGSPAAGALLALGADLPQSGSAVKVAQWYFLYDEE